MLTKSYKHVTNVSLLYLKEVIGYRILIIHKTIMNNALSAFLLYS